jgi:hypothetical protein
LEDRVVPSRLGPEAPVSAQPGNPNEVAGSSQTPTGTNGSHQSGSAVQTSTGTLNLSATHPAAALAYSPAYGTLFGPRGPSFLDVQQGAVGDCWLESSLAEVAARYPSVIQSMFTYEGTAVENGSQVGVYAVRFYNNNGQATYVTVDTELPGGGSYYDHPVGGAGAVNGSSAPVLWVALAEKAYAEANGAGLVTTNYPRSGSYAALNGGNPAWALHAITGQPASDYSINPSNIAAAWNQGKLVVLGTPSNQPPNPYIVADHAYALVGYNPSSSQPFEVFNPWGTQANGWAPGETNRVYGLFTANATAIAQNYAYDSIGFGAPGRAGAPDVHPTGTGPR